MSNGFRISQGLKQLHAKDENGRFHIGVDAFILIWKNLKYWKVIGFVVSVPVIYKIAEILYSIFANWRFNRLEHCTLTLQKENRK
jgi:predicted DCC family thiol-disulfide oxidoreductase YuxK